MYVHIPGMEKLLARLFGGVTPDLQLGPQDLELAKPIVAEASFAVRRRVLALYVLLIAIGGVVVTVRMWLDGPSQNAIVDDRLSGAC